MVTPAPHFDADEGLGTIAGPAPRALGAVLAGFLLISPIGTSSAGALKDASVRRAGDGTGAGGFVTIPEEASGTAAEVLGLRERSGWTWSELAQVLGVSRRAVHSWATGSRLTPAHAARLRRVSEVVDSKWRGDGPGTRLALATPDATGMSAFQRLVRAARPVSQRPEGFTPAELARRVDDSAPRSVTIVESEDFD